MPHYLYLARCVDGSLYAGTCVNLKEREAKHNEGTASKYTRSRLPVRFVYSEEFETLPLARSREAHVKRMTKQAKESLVLATAAAARPARRQRAPRSGP